MLRSSIIGSGSFGTALAAVLAQNCDEVRLWGRDAQLVEAINQKHENPTYLPGLSLPANIRASTDLEEVLAGSELVVSATPSHATRDVMGRAVKHLPRNVPIITVSKGIENQTLLTMTELLEDCLPEELHHFFVRYRPSLPARQDLAANLWQHRSDPLLAREALTAVHAGEALRDASGDALHSGCT